jgi:hypothetical protein
MAAVLINTRFAENRAESGVALSHASAANVPQFRFRLRQMLLFVTVICTVLGAIASTNGLLGLLLWIAAAVVAMHVFATTLGSRLRSESDAEQTRNAMAYRLDDAKAAECERSARIAAIQAAPRSPWHGHRATYLPWLPRIVVVAMILGGLAGAVILDLLIGRHASLPGIMVGAASISVLCGWGSFLCGNFYGVFRHGFREALAEQRKDDLQISHSH